MESGGEREKERKGERGREKVGVNEPFPLPFHFLGKEERKSFFKGKKVEGDFFIRIPATQLAKLAADKKKRRDKGSGREVTITFFGIDTLSRLVYKRSDKKEKSFLRGILDSGKYCITTPYTFSFICLVPVRKSWHQEIL